jgi:hypothetical protein
LIEQYLLEFSAKLLSGPPCFQLVHIGLILDSEGPFANRLRSIRDRLITLSCYVLYIVIPDNSEQCQYFTLQCDL